MTDNSHQLDDINPHTGEPYKVRPNKTQLKRDMKVLHGLGRELVELAQNKLDNVTLSERMFDAIVSAKKMKKSALQRQFRFISSIMDDEEVETIQLELKQLATPQQKEVEELHQIEGWRDQLISGDNNLLEQLVTEIDADRQQMRQLIRNADKENQQNKPPKSSRLLFQYLKELQENA